MIDFGFAFNTTNFSDRVLHVEIVSSSDECLHLKSDRKRKGEDLDKENGDEVVLGNDSESSKVVKVTTLHICSAILAANSPYFYKLFKNGMRESHQRHFTLRINPSEEASLMDLLNFIYGNTISATTAPDLLDVLVVADKFEVASCVRFCSWSLQKLPMSLESALLYLELPSSVLMDEAVKPLTDAAKAYLSPFYELKEEAMALPLSTLEAFVRSDDVQVNLEDDVFDFIQKWGHAHYPNPEEYREILNKRLVGFIRFPYMSCWKLKEVLVCPDLDHEQVSKLVREALFFKAGLPCTTLVANPRLVERVYKYRPIKVVQFQLPIWPRCVVYFDLKKDECVNLFPSKRLCSQSFHLGGNCFFLKAKCDMDLSTSSYHFGLFVYMSEGNRYKACTLDYEFEVKKKPFEDQYQSKYKVSDCIFTKGDFVGKHNLFEIPWPDFISEDNDYFINEILHLRAELTLKDSTPLKYKIS